MFAAFAGHHPLFHSFASAEDGYEKMLKRFGLEHREGATEYS